MILKNKIALVTGGGVGIGAASAMALAEAGASVVVADIDGAAAEAMTQSIIGAGGAASALVADCGDVGEIQAMIDETVEVYGRLDIILNNAGVTRRADIMDITETDWDRIHRVNAKGVFFCLQTAAAVMINQGGGGRIINIASIAGRGYAGTSNAAYAASKGAVISLTKSAAQQLARHDINVNAICPGVTNTALSQANLTVRAQQEGVSVEEMTKRRAAMIPIGRPNDPEDIAAMVVFLASPASRNITGQAYNVDGGIVLS
jgi:NAD(P)-dependent dehydrogenase (short-subunit alcohol dehydrogenase family)